MTRENTNTRGPGSMWADNEAGFAALERLPGTVRRALQDAAVPFGCETALALLRDHHADAIVQLIEESEVIHIAAFAKAYRASHGTPYPHLAAGASIQRGGYA